MRVRSVRTSVRPSSWPSTWTDPDDGCRYSEAIRISEVLPEPLRPSTTQRSPGRTVQSTWSRIVRCSRTSDTSTRSSTGAGAGARSGDGTDQDDDGGGGRDGQD